MLKYNPAREAEYLREREANERKAATLALTDSARRHHEEMAQQYALMLGTLLPPPTRDQPKPRRAFLSWFA